eukprot:6192791-Pleurochrysis_carterae.AAC.1
MIRSCGSIDWLLGGVGLILGLARLVSAFHTNRCPRLSNRRPVHSPNDACVSVLVGWAPETREKYCYPSRRRCAERDRGLGRKK